MKFTHYSWVLLFSAAFAHGSTVIFTDDFETGSLSNFTIVDSTAGSNSASIIVGDNGNTSQVAHVSAEVQGTTNFPGAWIQANGVSLDAALDFSVSFDFLISSQGSFDDAMFLFGDLDGAQYYGITLNEHAPSNDVHFYNGTSRTQVLADYQSGLSDETWYSATVSWTAATTTLNYEVTPFGGGAAIGSFSDSTLSLSDVQLGWGGLNDSPDFDNISVSVIPEPGVTSLLAGLLGLSFLRRRS